MLPVMSVLSWCESAEEAYCCNAMWLPRSSVGQDTALCASVQYADLGCVLPCGIWHAYHSVGMLLHYNHTHRVGEACLAWRAQTSPANLGIVHALL